MRERLVESSIAVLRPASAPSSPPGPDFHVSHGKCVFNTVSVHNLPSFMMSRYKRERWIDEGYIEQLRRRLCQEQRV